MAVDNFYRLIVSSPRHASDFRRHVAQPVDQPTIGRIKDWRPFVPLLKLLALTSLGAIVVFLTCACSGEVSGTVFVRSGSGETKPQGGLEVRLLDFGIKTEKDSLDAQYEQRLKEKTALKAALDSANAALDKEITRWRDDIDSKIDFPIRSVRREKRIAWLFRLRGSVVNRTDMTLTTVQYQLFCSDELIAANHGGSSTLFTGNLLDDNWGLKPDRSFQVDDDFYLIADGLENTERGNALFGCPTDKLRTKIVGFKVRDSYGKDELDVAQFCRTEEAEARRRDVAPLAEKWNKRGGVADLDAALQAAIEKHTKVATHTDVNGHYRFDDIGRGSYYLSAPYASAVDDTGWFAPVAVTGKTTLDLSNFNLSDPRLGAPLRK